MGILAGSSAAGSMSNLSLPGGLSQGEQGPLGAGTAGRLAGSGPVAPGTRWLGCVLPLGMDVMGWASPKVVLHGWLVAVGARTRSKSGPKIVASLPGSNVGQREGCLDDLQEFPALHTLAREADTRQFALANRWLHVGACKLAKNTLKDWWQVDVEFASVA